MQYNNMHPDNGFSSVNRANAFFHGLTFIVSH